ncbi:MAG: T9SS type A sorting domain-containing protein, partial [Chitinophagaceae bacterium]
RNTLISQTLTLGLNIGLNKDFADFELPETLYLRHTGSCDGEGDDDEDEDEDYTTIHEYAVDEDFVGKTPLEIFKAASAALLENTSDNSTRTKYAGIAGFLNEAFDECAAVIDLSEVPGSKTQKGTTVQTAGASNFEVKAYPNPFTNLVNFSFKAPVAGEVTVEIFDMTGRRLDIIRKTSTFAGQQNLIQFRANQNTAGQLLYKVSVGNYSVLGKLVNAKN